MQNKDMERDSDSVPNRNKTSEATLHLPEVSDWES